MWFTGGKNEGHTSCWGWGLCDTIGKASCVTPKHDRQTHIHTRICMACIQPLALSGPNVPPHSTQLSTDSKKTNSGPNYQESGKAVAVVELSPSTISKDFLQRLRCSRKERPQRVALNPKPGPTFSENSGFGSLNTKP